MGILVGVVFRLLMWVVLPLLLIGLLVGPGRSLKAVRSFWTWLWGQQTPTEVFNRVVANHQKGIQSLRSLLQRNEATRDEIRKNLKRCEDAVPVLEQEARTLLEKGDEIGARAALSRMNLEQQAAASFADQLSQQQERITRARRRLHLLELQLRQYEIGRNLLLEQLAEARTVEQQYAMANQFDPSGAIAAWMETEGMVAEEVRQARAMEHVFLDTADLPLCGRPTQVEPELLDAQLARLKAETQSGEHTSQGS